MIVFHSLSLSLLRRFVTTLGLSPPKVTPKYKSSWCSLSELIILTSVTTTGCGLVTSPAELLFMYLRVDRTVEVIGISSEFKVGSWNGNACRVLTVSCLLLLGELGLNTPTVSSYNSMGTTDSFSIISLSYQLISVCFTGTPCSQAVRINR